MYVILNFITFFLAYFQPKTWIPLRDVVVKSNCQTEKLDFPLVSRADTLCAEYENAEQPHLTLIWDQDVRGKYKVGSLDVNVTKWRDDEDSDGRSFSHKSCSCGCT